jgi:hypothetical protein
MGSVDILPIEAQDFDGYKLLCAVGYNKALTEDMDKLSSFVNAGGKLFIGLAQMSVTTNRDAIENYDLEYTDHPFAKAVAPEICFADDSLGGEKIRVNVNIPDGARVLKTTDSGRALIYEIEAGEGRVYLLNTLEYAGNPAIYAAVKEFVASLSQNIFDEEKVWAKGDDVVHFATFAQKDGSRHIYFLAIDWFNADSPIHKATLRVGEKDYSIDVRYGTMIKAVVSGDVAAWFDCEDCDVLEVGKNSVKVQGIGQGKLFVARNGEIKAIDVDFGEKSLFEVEI